MTNSKYEPLFQKIKFPTGIEIDARIAMAPMVIAGSSYEGNIEEDDIAFFDRRAQTAPLLITGAAYIGPYGNAFGYGLGNYNDNQIPGMKKMSDAMKSKGAKAIMQLFHPGREARYSFKDEGVAYGPSSMEFDFLPYPVTGFTSDEIQEYIAHFAKAAVRAIEAGFDGVEIHGANHYLLQQFFSAFSNQREDEWGGSRENRAAFPLSVVKAIKKVVKEHGADNFLIGFRISPEEIHGEYVGYTFDDALYLIDRVAEEGVDYIHTSQWGERAYEKKPVMGNYQAESINKTIHKILSGRALLIGAGDITSPDKALDALNHVDIAAIASVAIVDPDFVQKIREKK